jgi:serine/threonine protein kinase
VSAPKKPAQNDMPVFGRWRMTRPVGRGGFGMTLEVKHLDTDKFAIVKVINPNHFGDDYDDYVRRFKREMRILSELKHPHICKLYEANFDSEQPWFAMERYQGNTVEQELEQYGPADEKIWFDRARDILSALEYAHSKKIMHGDLNPGNIIIDGRGAKLIDFGIARKNDPSASNSTTIFGANGWTAPEHGTLPPGIENDIFVAASLLVYFGTGNKAFKGNRVNNYHDAIRADVPDYTGLSTNQQLLLRPMHEKSRAKRITATRALAELERLQPSASAKSIVGKAKSASPAVAKAKASAPEIKKVAQAAFNKPLDLAKEPLVQNGAKKAMKYKGLTISAIFTGGFSLLSYWLVTKIERTKHLPYSLKFPISLSIFFHVISFGILAPFITIWWGRKISFKGIKAILGAQCFFSSLAFIGTVAEANQSPSGFLWSIRTIAIVFGAWGFIRILNDVAPQTGIAAAKEQETPAKKSESKVEVREGLVDSMLVGTYGTWEEIEAFFAKVLSKKDGKRFIFEIESDVISDIYFQGYSESDSSRTIEAAADLSVRPRPTDDQKNKMAKIGWELPSEGLPNFIMFLDVNESGYRSLASIFTRSLKEGYGLEIGTFRVLAPVR